MRSFVAFSVFVCLFALYFFAIAAIFRSLRILVYLCFDVYSCIFCIFLNVA